MVGKNCMTYFTKGNIVAHDKYAFENIDADYDEMEFGIDDEDDDQTFLDGYMSELQYLMRF